MNWQTKKLGDACNIVGGGTPKTDIKEYWSNEVVWITPKDLGQLNDYLIVDSSKKISHRGLKRSSAKLLPKGSVVLSSRAPIGYVAIAGIELATNQGCRNFICGDEIYNKYLYYFLKSNTDLLNQLGEGSTFKEISGSKLKELKIPLPPLSEQHRIVKILDEVFEKLEKAKENTEKNLANAKELFESYLQNIFESPRKDWEEKTLEEISLEFGRGKSKHRPRNDKKLYGGEYPFIQTGDIRNSEHFITEYSQTYNHTGLLQSKLWPKGTICITIAANIAETGILNFDACFPDSIIGLVVNPKKSDTDFVEYLLQFFKTRIQAKGKGSAQANINMATFEDEKFPIPPLSEQKAIVKKLDQLSEQTKKLEGIYQKKLADIEELKKSVLQQAFSGKL